MSVTELFTLDCVITRRVESGTVDADGNDVPDESTVATVCELQQRQRSEDTALGEVGRSEWDLFLPAGIDIELGDTATVEGTAYELLGEPWAVRNPRTGVASHVEATVARSEGGTHAS